MLLVGSSRLIGFAAPEDLRKRMNRLVFDLTLLVTARLTYVAASRVYPPGGDIVNDSGFL